MLCVQDSNKSSGDEVRDLPQMCEANHSGIFIKLPLAFEKSEAGLVCFVKPHSIGRASYPI